MTTASICTIGDEILIGQIVDTNSSGIAKALNNIGIQVSDMHSVGDLHDEITGTLTSLLEEHNIVITTGGTHTHTHSLSLHSTFSSSGCKANRWFRSAKNYTPKYRYPLTLLLSPAIQPTFFFF